MCYPVPRVGSNLPLIAILLSKEEGCLSTRVNLVAKKAEFACREGWKAGPFQSFSIGPRKQLCESCNFALSEHANLLNDLRNRAQEGVLQIVFYLLKIYRTTQILNILYKKLRLQVVACFLYLQRAPSPHHSLPSHPTPFPPRL